MRKTDRQIDCINFSKRNNVWEGSNACRLAEHGPLPNWIFYWDRSEDINVSLFACQTWLQSSLHMIHSNCFALHHRCLERTGEFSQRLQVPLSMKTGGNGGLRTGNFNCTFFRGPFCFSQPVLMDKLIYRLSHQGCLKDGLRRSSR